MRQRIAFGSGIRGFRRPLRGGRIAGVRNLIRTAVVLTGLVAVAAGGMAAAQTEPERPRIAALDLEGVVDPFMADYVSAGIASANDAGLDAVLLEIDTPGGFDSSMREIVQSITGSRVPVLCFVAPSGARAASAGTFILLSCPVAAMAPGTNVGAAHPVGVSGAIVSEKVVNDSVAYIRSLANLHGRNADWAERAVRDSVSVPAEEALDLGVIDLVANDRADLLTRVDGRSVEVAGGERVVLHTAGATVQTDQMGPVAFLLHSLITPDFAFLFFVLGLILIVVELLHPGVSIPGILGALLLVFALLSFGMLPVQLAGVVMLIISVGFFLVELKHPGVGLPAIGGVVFLVLGGLFLFDPAVPNVQVSPWLVAVMGAIALLFFGVVVRASLNARRLPPPPGLERLIGSMGVVVRELDPVGVVRVGSEEWSAVTHHPPVPAGRRVEVVTVEGLRLEVEPPRQVQTGTPVSPGPDEGSTK
jgi:membrane-bound serine protease (ClpP class)